MSRTLIYEDDTHRVYEVTDDQGEVVGTDTETIPTAEQTNEETIRSAVRGHLADLHTIRNTTGTLTGAQLSNAVRALAKGQIHVIRLLVGALDSTD